ncbi:MAG: CHASE2 domain-containing protein [Proteobacteria bacterium]|nr:CHASE2 domain-containing protein [Pseudomonadota bacterium]
MRRLVGWLLSALPYLMLAMLFVLRLQDPQFIQTIRYKTFDFYQKTWPRGTSTAPVYILNIDEKSLAEVGQWPWPRTVIAKLVENAFEHEGIKTLAFDVVFAEPDRTAPEVVSKDWNLPEGTRKQLAELPKNDDVLARAFAKYPVVAGYAFEYTTDSQPVKDFEPKVSVNIAGGSGLPNVPQAANVIRNIPKLEKAASGTGFFSFNPDADGIVRKPPLVTAYNGQYFPILGIEALRLWKDTRSFVALTDSFGDVKGFKIKNLVLPTDAEGNFWVRYRELDPQKYISASDVLHGRVQNGLLKDAIVFVGTSASGLLDIRATPVHPSMPGVDVHAQMVENILDGQFLTRDYNADLYEQMFLLGMGIALILMVEFFGALTGGFVAVSILALVALLSVQAFRYMNMLVDVVYPSMTVIAVYMVHNVIKYAREESQRKAIRHAFSHYLSGDLVNALTHAPEQLKLGGEQKHMTMLFSDIRGFTTLSEGLTPQELTALLNEYLTPMTDIVMSNKGTIDKYMGDAIMAFWNAPLDIPDHERLACVSALAMLDKLRDLNAKWSAENRPTIKMGLGLHCGTVTVGNMGSTQRFDYTVLGDAVNLASRLEGLCKLYGVQVIISGDMRSKVTDALCMPLDLVAVKGKTEPVDIYALLALGTGTPEQQKAAQTAEAAMAAYRAQNWKEAEKLFGSLDGFDVLKELYLERIAAFRKKAPPKSWDGVYVATSK